MAFVAQDDTQQADDDRPRTRARNRYMKRLGQLVGTQSLHRHALRLANRFRAGIGLEPGDSAIESPFRYVAVTVT